jgi:hypothetical protein
MIVCGGAVNLSSDFSHPPKLLRIRLMPFENAIFGVKNAILGIAYLIKPCNQADNPFIKNKPETWLFSEQRLWCGGVRFTSRFKFSENCIKKQCGFRFALFRGDVIRGRNSKTSPLW